MTKAKEVERRYLEVMIAALPDLRSHSIVCRESPDFLLARGDETIGVEVTRYSDEDSGPLSPLGQASLRARVLATADRIYREHGGKPRFVDVGFNDSPALTKLRVPSLAAEIAELLLGVHGEIVLYEEGPLIPGATTPRSPEVSDISAVRVQEEKDGGWVTGDGGWAWHVGHAEISRIVARKEPLVQRYRDSCPVVWLIIGFDLSAVGTAVHPPTVPVEFSIDTSFDRVYCVHDVMGQVVEIPIRR